MTESETPKIKKPRVPHICPVCEHKFFTPLGRPAKIDHKQVLTLRARRKSLREIAKALNCSPAIVHYILKKEGRK